VSTQPSAQSCPALEKLDQGSQYKLVLFVAPPGSGKSRLIHHWIQHSNIFQPVKPLYLRLEPGDNQANKLLSKLVRELEKWNVSIENHDLAQIDYETKPALSAELHPLIESLLNDVINGVMRLTGDRFLIMLNYHLIEDLNIHKLVSYLLDYLPPQLHLVINSQTIPPLQIPRLRARRELLEIGPEDIKSCK
jgi:LuxR family maltose regulon positive regulatory protein